MVAMTRPQDILFMGLGTKIEAEYHRAWLQNFTDSHRIGNASPVSCDAWPLIGDALDGNKQMTLLGPREEKSPKFLIPVVTSSIALRLHRQPPKRTR